MDEYQKSLLEQVAGLHEVPAGAYNIRANGQAAGRQSTEHIEIVTKEEKPVSYTHLTLPTIEP